MRAKRRDEYPITQNDIDIREIECALDLYKRGRTVIWSCVREAVDRLQASEKTWRLASGETASKEG